MIWGSNALGERLLRDDKPQLALTIALIIAVVYLVAYFANYSHWFIHPHQFEIHLPKLLPDGTRFHLRDFGKVFQLFDPAENRTRFLGYAVVLLNLHLRMWCYEWFVLFPPFSVGWIFELLIGPALLYRLLLNLFPDRRAAVAGVLVYLTSIGFLSGFGMPLIPGKPLTNVVFISVMFWFSEIRKRAMPGQLFLEVPGCGRERVALFLVLLAGLFLDEVPLFAFLLPLVFFHELFFAPLQSKDTVKRVMHGSVALASPGLAYGVLVLAVVPRITMALYGYRFDFLGSVFVNKAAREAGKSFFSGPLYGFGIDSLWTDFISLVGTSVAPWQAAGLATHPSGSGVVTGLHTGIVAVGAVLALVVSMSVLTIRSETVQRSAFSRAAVATLLFILFMSLLSGRHVPYFVGYVYGCAFPVLFSVLFASVAAMLLQIRWGKSLVVIAACYVAAVQVDNFQAINKSWIDFHNEHWTKATYQKQFHIADNRPLTRRELHAIWKSWKAGNLDSYLSTNEISSGAVFLIFELRWLDKSRLSHPDD